LYRDAPSTAVGVGRKAASRREALGRARRVWGRAACDSCPRLWFCYSLSPSPICWSASPAEAQRRWQNAVPRPPTSVALAGRRTVNTEPLTALVASHSHERHTVHGLHEHKSHEQDVPRGDGNKGGRLCSFGQSFQPIDKPARYRQNL